jgi:hypothetical protein
VNSATLSKIQTFREQVLLPALEDIEAKLENPQQRVAIAHNAETGIMHVDVMLQQMHSGKRYLTQGSSRPLTATESSTSPQTWIGDSVYIDILQDSETEPICMGQYCLSLEFRITPVDSSAEQIQIASIIGSIKPGVEPLQIQSRIFEDGQHPLDIDEIDQTEIASHFIESWEVFEAQISAQEEEVILLEPTTPSTPEPDLAFDPIESDPVQPFPTPGAQSTPRETSPESAPDPKPVPEPAAQSANSTLNPQQQRYLLQQKALDLSRQLAPSPHSPLSCKLNPELSTTAQIVAQRDRYERIVDLCLEYSPTIADRDLEEHLQRLGHYRHLEHLANQRRFLEAQLQDWLKRYGQPSDGAIAHRLQDRIAQQSKTLYHHLHHRAESCLASLTAQDLQTELTRFATQQQREQDILDALEQNPILGYLDTRLLERDTLLESIHPFTDTDPQAITFHAKSLKRKGREENSSLILTHIAACQSEAYQVYRQRYPSLPILPLAIRYTLNQKLYPNRPISVGLATKETYPRLELLWGGTDATTPPDRFLTQIWRSFPLLRSHPPQWLVVTATSETQKLKTIALEDGRIAQEGTKEYLERSLQQMTQSPQEYTRELGTLVLEALEQGRMKWMHLHQTEDLETGEPRDIVQLQFQLSELR